MTTISLSSSALSYGGCVLAFKRAVIDGYKEPASSANIVYGEAVHKYIDMMFKTNGHIPTAMAAAIRTFNQPKVDKSKSPHLSDQRHMISCAFNVWETWVKEDKDFQVLMLDLPCWNCVDGFVKDYTGVIFADGTREWLSKTCEWCSGQGHYLCPATELTFSIPYYKDNFITVNLEGTIDSIGKVVGGCYAIRDWKTTSTWDAKNYFFPYSMSKQLRFYLLALKLMAEREPMSILGQIGSKHAGAIIDAIFVKPSANDIKCGRSEVFQFDDKELEKFRSMLDGWIRQLSLHVQYGDFPKQGLITGACEKKFGLCPFFTVCGVNDQIADVLLKRDFKQVKYNPLNYSGL